MAGFLWGGGYGIRKGKHLIGSMPSAIVSREVYKDAYDEIGFPSKRCCQARLGVAVSGMMLPTKVIKTKQIGVFSRHVPKRRDESRVTKMEEKDGEGRIELLKGGFCRSERGTKLKMSRGRGRDVSINTRPFYFAFFGDDLDRFCCYFTLWPGFSFPLGLIWFPFGFWLFFVVFYFLFSSFFPTVLWSTKTMHAGPDESRGPTLATQEEFVFIWVRKDCMVCRVKALIR